MHPHPFWYALWSPGIECTHILFGMRSGHQELKKNEGKDGYFRLKLAWLDRELGKLHQQVAGAKPIKVEVDRNDLFHDSFRAFARLSREKLRCPFQIKFKKVGPSPIPATSLPPINTASNYGFAPLHAFVESVY